MKTPTLIPGCPQALEGSPYAWLLELLAAFDAGDLEAYDAACAKHAPLLNSQARCLI